MIDQPTNVISQTAKTYQKKCKPKKITKTIKVTLL